MHKYNPFSAIILLLGILAVSCASLQTSSDNSKNTRTEKREKVSRIVPPKSTSNKNTNSSPQREREAEVKLITASKHIDNKQIQQAMAILDLPERELKVYSGKTRSNWYHQLARAHQHQQDWLQYIDSADKSIPFADKKDRQQRSDALIKQVMLLDSTTKTILAKQPQKNIQGWGELGLLLETLEASSGKQKQQYLQWQRGNQNHNANLYKPDLVNQVFFTAEPLPKTAILLPLSGPLAGIGNAILEGFKSINGGLAVQVFDVHSTDTLDKAVADIHASEVTHVVGPLTRSLVNRLTNQSHDFHIIALNEVLSGSSTTEHKVAGFSLAIEDEGTYIANLLDSAGYSRADVLLENSNKHAVRTWEAFRAAWSGETKLHRFSTSRELTDGISRMTGVTNATIRALKSARKSGKSKSVAKIQRDQNLQATILFAEEVIAVQVIPLMNFYLAGDVPVVATSRIFSHDTGGKKLKDINRIYFTDINTTTWTQVEWGHMLDSGKSFQPKLARFYAFGADAAILTTQLDKLYHSPGVGVVALTGTLSYNLDEKRIIRRPALFQIQREKVIRAKIPTLNSETCIKGACL